MAKKAVQRESDDDLICRKADEILRDMPGVVPQAWRLANGEWIEFTNRNEPYFEVNQDRKLYTHELQDYVQDVNEELYKQAQERAKAVLKKPIVKALIRSGTLKRKTKR